MATNPALDRSRSPRLRVAEQNTQLSENQIQFNQALDDEWKVKSFFADAVKWFEIRTH